LRIQTALGKSLVSGAGVIFAASWIIGIRREYWAVRIPDKVHPYGIRFKGGTDLFFTPRLGWFLDRALWIFFLLLLVAFGMEWLGQRRNRAS
jgi:hypothetical protein